MQLCSKCKKNVAMIQIMKSEGTAVKQEFLCLSCAKKMNLGMVDSVIKQLGIDPDQVDEFCEQMTESMKDADPEMLEKLGDPSMLKDLLNSAMQQGDSESLSEESHSTSDHKEERTSTTETKDKETKKVKHKFLETYGTNLTNKAARGEIDKIVGRDKELDRVIQILNRRQKNNPVLIGEPGVGKTAIAEGLATAIVEGKVPERLKNYEIIQLDMTGMVAGTQFRGQFEARIKGVVDEAIKCGNIILVIDELHNIVGAGNAEGAMNAANILKPVLARGELRIIGATTLDEYRKHIEKDSALERRFQPVMVNEPSILDAIEIMKAVRPYYEKYHGVTISDHILERMVTLSERYVTDRFLPDKAIDIMDEAASRANLKNTKLQELDQLTDKLADTEAAVAVEEARTQPDYEKLAQMRQELCVLQDKVKALAEEAYSFEVSFDDVAGVVEMWTGIPINKVSEAEGARLLKLEESLHERVIGQEKAINSVSSTIRRCRAGLRAKKRPASFIFVGPTGVGKTELVKALTQELFGTEEAMVRLDMSEFMEKHTTSKLIGSPPGYVGYDEAGQLTEKIRRRPYSVILMDEIEKAHQDVFNILLQILDDGRLTDSQGRVVNFENTVIVMTSNAGTTLKVGDVGFGSDTTDRSEARIKSALKSLFRPEFLNRVDDIVVFDKLTETELRQILDLQINMLAKDLMDKKITITVTDGLKDYLLNYERNDAFGARPLKRSIQRNIEERMARMYLEGTIVDGDSLTLDVDDNGPVITKQM
ncbi:MAG: ATP-dependent Clp protease ATP-binding subunit [Clostridia bacterium]|nr:ATP-dependent Clp protease ATP-binding subunit [Clostridia bacterium]